MDDRRGLKPVAGGLVRLAFGVEGTHWACGFHKGVDLVWPPGAPMPADGVPVRAWRDGTVAWAGDGGDDYGVYVKLSHGAGVVSFYAHLKRALVRAGTWKEPTRVRRGDVIGIMGNTGNVLPRPTPENPDAGTHLHFEVRMPVEPLLEGE